MNNMKTIDRQVSMKLNWKFCNSNHICLEHCFIWGKFESDFARITKGLFVHEYEIKDTRSDYLKDFSKKLKHEKIAANSSGLASFTFVCKKGIVKEKTDARRSVRRCKRDSWRSGCLHVVRRNGDRRLPTRNRWNDESNYGGDGKTAARPAISFARCAAQRHSPCHGGDGFGCRPDRTATEIAIGCHRDSGISNE